MGGLPAGRGSRLAPCPCPPPRPGQGSWEMRQNQYTPPHVSICLSAHPCMDPSAPPPPPWREAYIHALCDPIALSSASPSESLPACRRHRTSLVFLRVRSSFPPPASQGLRALTAGRNHAVLSHGPQEKCGFLPTYTITIQTQPPRGQIQSVVAAMPSVGSSGGDPCPAPGPPHMKRPGREESAPEPPPAVFCSIHYQSHFPIYSQPGHRSSVGRRVKPLVPDIIISDLAGASSSLS